MRPVPNRESWCCVYNMLAYACMCMRICRTRMIYIYIYTYPVSTYHIWGGCIGMLSWVCRGPWACHDKNPHITYIYIYIYDIYTYIYIYICMYNTVYDVCVCECVCVCFSRRLPRRRVGLNLGLGGFSHVLLGATASAECDTWLVASQLLVASWHCYVRSDGFL